MSPLTMYADKVAERGSVWCPHCGCNGWLWDSTDSGSGAQVYCDCAHGARLREHDLFERNKTAPRSPSSGDAGRGDGP